MSSNQTRKFMNSKVCKHNNIAHFRKLYLSNKLGTISLDPSLHVKNAAKVGHTM